MNYVCEVCKRADEQEPFRAPADEIGMVLMAEHLSDAHDEHGPKRRLQDQRQVTR